MDDNLGPLGYIRMHIMCLYDLWPRMTFMTFQEVMDIKISFILKMAPQNIYSAWTDISWKPVYAIGRYLHVWTQRKLHVAEVSYSRLVLHGRCLIQEGGLTQESDLSWQGSYTGGWSHMAGVSCSRVVSHGRGIIQEADPDTNLDPYGHQNTNP